MIPYKRKVKPDFCGLVWLKLCLLQNDKTSTRYSENLMLKSKRFRVVF